MPTYEYQCKKCNCTFEKFQPITAPPLKYCPKCNGEVYRLISKNGNFILKGSGYYSTDNRKSNLPKERLSSSSDKVSKKDSDNSGCNLKANEGKAKKESASVK
ncbi:MAG TPA: zinc ribbon domain-containing protein [Atribacterota bacterium]|nr:zinc ribbon domain-containing protein [Atribacterota bacterium]